MLIEAGEPLTYVQQQLGHSTAFTLKVYGHLLPRGTRRAVDALDDATSRNQGSGPPAVVLSFPPTPVTVSIFRY
jgi:hypothetical protein